MVPSAVCVAVNAADAYSSPAEGAALFSAPQSPLWPSSDSAFPPLAETPSCHWQKRLPAQGKCMRFPMVSMQYRLPLNRKRASERFSLPIASDSHIHHFSGAPPRPDWPALSLPLAVVAAATAAATAVTCATGVTTTAVIVAAEGSGIHSGRCVTACNHGVWRPRLMLLYWLARAERKEAPDPCRHPNEQRQ